jgi:hypothetical protein
METLSERLAFQDRLDWALYFRRRAKHKLRIGDRSEHRMLMHDALFFLKLAREWKRK